MNEPWINESNYVGKILTIGEIKTSTDEDWENWSTDLLDFVADDGNREETNDKEVPIWRKNFKFLKDNLPDNPEFKDIPILFEYRPPLRNGRRMDAVILLDGKEIILEFKNSSTYDKSQLTQLNGYIYYLKTSHNITIENGLKIEGYLVRPCDIKIPETAEPEKFLNNSNFTEIISKSISGYTNSKNIQDWVESETVSIPSIYEGMINIFKNGDNEKIRYLKSSDLGKSLPYINEKIKEAQTKGEKSLIIVDGIPGSGKTYLGMEVMFEQMSAGEKPVYLSGNGPLINYMQALFSLDDLTDIQSSAPTIMEMKTFKNEYFKNLSRVPKYNVLVFDESQRAWDERKMKSSYSEIEGLLRLGDRTQQALGSCVILCLYGTGQVIYEGEEGGIDLWKNAMKNHSDWNYYASEIMAKELKGSATVITSQALHLDTSIRTNFIDISPWIEALIDNTSIDQQKALTSQVLQKGFYLFVTRNFNNVRSIIDKYNIKDCGVLVSSFINTYKLKKITDNKVQSSYISANDAGKWFLKEKESLKVAATEFACQGLELSWPIILFGGDLYLDKNGKWFPDIPPEKRKKFKDPDAILINIYRVLLSRGREGMFIVIPEDDKMDETYNRFVEIGCIEIK